ncbi:hydrogenase expression/formation protein, partial [SAR202 cluster bacterium AC-409-J13_OGT_754m]|nr:hydrogenase expression/formation protein [SAR202 cluster bacterium AC-409-J13_OGT_754m]
GDSILVAKTDPITLASDMIGWYAVQINANDVACSGAKPRWFMATLLLPRTYTENEISTLFQQILEACKQLGVSLIGGHTEITQGISQPIVVGCMLGEVHKDRVITTNGARPGDSIIITKGISIEGSALLARESREQLLASGVEPSCIDKAADFLFTPGISIVKDALTACSSSQVHSLHDPTEGGLATGLWEISKASNTGMLISEKDIPVLPECESICKSLGLDPLGLLASGALLITLPTTDAQELIGTLSSNGIPAAEIGYIKEPNFGVMLEGKYGLKTLPTFERDELARFLDD